MAFTNKNNLGDVSQDVALDHQPGDSISELSWSPVANHIAVASWDQTTRIYDVSKSAKGEGKALIQFPRPVLSCAWSPDGSKVIGAGADGSARILDLGGNEQALHVAQHDAPVRVVRMVSVPNSQSPIAVTGSWDRTIRYWDLRQQEPIGIISCPERVYALEVSGNQLLAATAERHLALVDLNQPTTIAKRLMSPLQKQTRTIAWMPGGTGYAVASIEGRCGINYIDESNKSSNFTFRCHRHATDRDNRQHMVFAANAVSFHPRHPHAFGTAGSDGNYCFWDKDAHSRLKTFPVEGPITSASFNFDGSIFAYSISYDWSKGYSYNTPNHPTKVVLHPVSDSELKSKSTASQR